MDYVIATPKRWYRRLVPDLEQRTGHRFHLLDSRDDLTPERLQSIAPRYVFFPHWSWIISEEIHGGFECVVFHMTDLPFGRGGSPLQNLISRGIYETKISAIRVVEELDAGPVYMKEPLCLHGSAEEIFLRAADVVVDMIESIVQEEPDPVPQEGEPTEFSRRTPDESNISSVSILREFHDHIRMLDAEGYPKAFLETDAMRLEFTNSVLRADSLEARVRITRRDVDG